MNNREQQFISAFIYFLIDVTGGTVTGGGTDTITIAPTSDFDALTEYYVQIDATAFDDEEVNSFAGIADSTTWSFTTDGTAGVTVGTASGNTSEAGDTATVAVQLDTRPTADVTIPVSSSNTGEGTVSPSSLTFTSENWDTPQNVTVTGVNDDVDDGDVAFNVVLGAATSADSNYSGVNASDAAVTNTDDDTAIITITPGQLEVTEGGDTDILSAVLATEPTDDVTINFSVAGSEVTLSVSALTFTSENWDTPQTITVTAVDDSIDEDEENETINFSVTSDDAVYGAADPYYRGVTVTDNDTGGVTVSEASQAVTEGGATDTYTVVLNTEPTADVTIAVAASGSDVSVSPATLTFTSENWDTAQTVTVTAVDDETVEDSETATITHTVTSDDSVYDEIEPDSVTVTVTDNDEASEEDESPQDPETGEGDGSGDTEETLGAVTKITRKRGNEITVTYEGGETKDFDLFMGSTKAKAGVHKNGKVVVAVSKGYMRTFDAFTGERYGQKKLLKKRQDQTKLKTFNIYKSNAQNNVVVLSRRKVRQKKQIRLVSFVIKGNGKIVKRNSVLITLPKKVNFKNLTVTKNKKSGKKARIRLTQNGKTVKGAVYKVTKKKGQLKAVK